MQTRMIIALVGVLSLAIDCQCLCVDAAFEEKKPAKKATSEEIKKLVRDLGSKNGATRESATKALVKIGEPALPHLKDVLKTDDLELRRRAESLYVEINENVVYAKTWALGLDVMVGRMVRKGKDLTKEDWALVVKIADAIRKEGIDKGSKIKTRENQFLDWKVVFAKDIVNKSPEGPALFNNRVVCESAHSERQFTGTLLLCKGKVSGPVCDGDSIIFANGNVKFNSAVDKSIVICSGEIETFQAVSSVLIARRGVKSGFKKAMVGCWVVDNEYGDQSPRYFFAPSAVGIKVQHEKDGVRVVGIEAGSTFSGCGFKAGDKIVRVNMSPIESQESFHSLLRQSVIEYGGVFDVRRGNEGMQIKVSFPM